MLRHQLKNSVGSSGDHFAVSANAAGNKVLLQVQIDGEQVRAVLEPVDARHLILLLELSLEALDALSFEAANALWDVLVAEVGANEAERDFFVHGVRRSDPARWWPLRTIDWDATLRIGAGNRASVHAPNLDGSMYTLEDIDRVNALLADWHTRFAKREV
jgi:hypothetical protein